MKSIFAGMSMLMLGAALAVGCGGPEVSQEETQTPAPTQTSASGNPTTTSEEPSPWTDGQTGAGKVGEAAACCYVKCSKWHGPFPNVAYGNCTNYGRYYCGQAGGGAFSDAKWDDC
ncbi:hypothetical protein CYFUS_004420 [Cystobacter fuscus]|uniref:Lipoprotein n=1 Tax=Cystobacter fuscus TaxID=43 RepID=A0A250J6C8_9BACT|nr:hypothetical protein [Cystobacter fuscus]ATB38981.1 hypothetical protein CYFUS_004420 [Cystobacter fuscus]